MASPAFTDEQVIAMRDLRRARNVSTETLAEHFGVNRRTVWRALVGDSYRHLNLDHPPVPDKVAAGRIVRGERNGASKLSDDEVLTIRRRLKQGESGVELARCFGVTPTQISRIKQGMSRQWPRLR